MPLPGRGYWAKKSAGQEPPRPALPPLKPGAKSEQAISERRSGNVTLSEELKSRLAAERDAEAKILVEEKLDSPHALVKHAAKVLRQAANTTAPAAVHETCPDLEVTRGGLDRALRVFDALLKAFEARGHTINVTPPGPPDPYAFRYSDRSTPTPSRTFVVVGEDRVQIGIVEQFDSVVVQPPRRRSTYGTGYYTPPPERQRQYNGKLTLAIKNTPYGYAGRHTWRDGRNQRVEDCLNSFVQGVITAADAYRTKRIDEERQRREAQERERRQAEERRRREEEAAKVKRLENELSSWRRAKDIRSYVAEARLLLHETGAQLTPESEEWLQWTLRHADAIDPLTPLRPKAPSTDSDDPSG